MIKILFTEKDDLCVIFETSLLSLSSKQVKGKRTVEEIL
jgi:hypothetical protein